VGLRVLHVAQTSEYGLGRYIADLVGEQVRAGWEVAVAGDPASEVRGRVVESGAAWLPWVASREPGPSVWREIRALRVVVDGMAPDVVHLHSSKAGLAGRLALRGRRPTIFQPHAWSFFAVEGVRRKLTVGWERFGARWADAVLCVGDDERRQGEEAGIRARFRVVPSAVDAELFHPAPRVEGQPPTAVCIGRLSVWQKGQDLLLAAWPAVVAAVPDAQLVFVGDGPDRGVLEAGAAGLPSVVFAGHQGDIVPWYQQADVVVQPSRYEGLSLTVLEALACGRPVVAGDATGMRETIGDAGAVVPVGDVAALAAAVIERLEHPRRAALEGKAARQRVEEKFSRRLWASALLDLTEQVSRRAPSP
jgi:glycosyltransferase involved in cell wall biosynthesis